VKSLARGYRIAEVPVRLTSRPQGSFSKIRIVQDGFVILNSVLSLVRDYKPLTFFGTLGLILIAVGLIPGGVVTVEFIKTGLVTHIPSAILAVALILAGTLLILAGLVLHTITRRFQELEHQLHVREKDSKRDSTSESFTTRR
jgi:hypothetical protein